MLLSIFPIFLLSVPASAVTSLDADFDRSGRDHRGLPVSSGIYLYEVRTGGFRAVRKMIMLK